METKRQTKRGRHKNGEKDGTEREDRRKAK